MTEILPMLWALLAASVVLVPPRLALRPRPHLVGVIAKVGETALSCVGRATMRAPPPFDSVACGITIVLAVAGWSIAGPFAGLVLGSAPLVFAGMQARAAARSATREIDDDLPEVIDLLRLAVGSGLTAALAVATVAGRAPGPVGAVLRSAVRQTTSSKTGGLRLPDALDAEAAATEGARQAMVPLLAALADATRDGSPLASTLDRLATESRASRRRRAEERARRVPVLLLLPLVCCTLPAVGLLTVIPVAAGAIRSLGS